MLRPLRVAITTGNQNGIGPEVVAKALRKIGPLKDVQFILWRNSEFPRKDYLRIKKKFIPITVNSWAEALNCMPSNHKEILDINVPTSPAHWVEEAATACFFKHLDALATAPLSKTTISDAGFNDLGHTEILKRVSQTQNAYMTFIGEKFNVFLATGHSAIKNIPEKISPSSLENALSSALSFAKLISKISKKNHEIKPLGVLGLNPHAGDKGLIGQEEIDFITPVIEKFKAQKHAVDGPLVPDSAFTPTQWKRYSVYLALYHDQGLIPFKTVHGQNGVHITWGLPFIRTSVDHGTAFDIAGQDKADATSMRLAIEWAIKLARGAKNG